MFLPSFIVKAQTSGGDISEGFDMFEWFNLDDSFTLFDSIISLIIAVVTVIAGIWFIFLLITGGLALMTAGDNKNAVEEARKKITIGLVGLLIVAAGLFIADLIGTIFGLDLLNPGTVLEGLTPN